MILQIGFNKCATTALFEMFRDAGYMALHSNGRYWRVRKHPALDGVMVQALIADNIAAGRAPFETLEEFDAFLDMEYSTETDRIENFRQFRAMAAAYPEALFILNTRHKSDWLRSRVRHHDGRYLADACAFHDLSPDDVIRKWADDFEDHNADVLTYFADIPERLCHFDTDADPISKVVRFVAPFKPVEARHWTMARVTDVKAEVKGWNDANRDLDVDAILKEVKAA